MPVAGMPTYADSLNRQDESVQAFNERMMELRRLQMEAEQARMQDLGQTTRQGMGDRTQLQGIGMQNQNRMALGAQNIQGDMALQRTALGAQRQEADTQRGFEQKAMEFEAAIKQKMQTGQFEQDIKVLQERFELGRQEAEAAFIESMMINGQQHGFNLETLEVGRVNQRADRQQQGDINAQAASLLNRRQLQQSALNQGFAAHNIAQQGDIDAQAASLLDRRQLQQSAQDNRYAQALNQTQSDQAVQLQGLRDRNQIGQIGLTNDLSLGRMDRGFENDKYLLGDQQKEQRRRDVQMQIKSAEENMMQELKAKSAQMGNLNEETVAAFKKVQQAVMAYTNQDWDGTRPASTSSQLSSLKKITASLAGITSDGNWKQESRIGEMEGGNGAMFYFPANDPQNPTFMGHRMKHTPQGSYIIDKDGRVNQLRAPENKQRLPSEIYQGLEANAISWLPTDGVLTPEMKEEIRNRALEQYHMDTEALGRSSREKQEGGPGFEWLEKAGNQLYRGIEGIMGGGGEPGTNPQSQPWELNPSQKKSLENSIETLYGPQVPTGQPQGQPQGQPPGQPQGKLPAYRGGPGGGPTGPMGTPLGTAKPSKFRSWGEYMDQAARGLGGNLQPTPAQAAARVKQKQATTQKEISSIEKKLTSMKNKGAANLSNAERQEYWQLLEMYRELRQQ